MYMSVAGMNIRGTRTDVRKDDIIALGIVWYLIVDPVCGTECYIVRERAVLRYRVWNR